MKIRMKTSRMITKMRDWVEAEQRGREETQDNEGEGKRSREKGSGNRDRAYI